MSAFPIPSMNDQSKAVSGTQKFIFAPINSMTPTPSISNLGAILNGLVGNSENGFPYESYSYDTSPALTEENTNTNNNYTKMLIGLGIVAAIGVATYLIFNRG